MNHIILCQVYEVLLIADHYENKVNYEADNIIKRIFLKVPTNKITVAEETDQKADELSLKPSFYNPRATSLILIIDA